MLVRGARAYEQGDQGCLRKAKTRLARSSRQFTCCVCQAGSDCSTSLRGRCCHFGSSRSRSSSGKELLRPVVRAGAQSGSARAPGGPSAGRGRPRGASRAPCQLRRHLQGKVAELVIRKRKQAAPRCTLRADRVGPVGAHAGERTVSHRVLHRSRRPRTPGQAQGEPGRG